MPSTVMTEGRDLGDPSPIIRGHVRNVPSIDLTPPPPTGQVVQSQQTVADRIVIVDPIGELSPAGHLGTREEIEAELDVVAAAIRAFHRKQADQVMREVAAYSARLTELCVLLHRREALDRQYTRVRTQQVERFLAELDRQFKIASRMIEVQRQDLELMR